MLLSQHPIADQPTARACAQGCAAPRAARWDKAHHGPATEPMGLAALCIGGGEANALSLELL